MTSTLQSRPSSAAATRDAGTAIIGSGFAGLGVAIALRRRAHVVPGDDTPSEEQVSGMLDRYVGWVETLRESHLAFVRGAGGGDPWVSEVYEETRGRLVDVALAALQLPDDALRRQLVLAWFAFTEDLVAQWVLEPTMTREELLDLLSDVLGRLTTR